MKIEINSTLTLIASTSKVTGGKTSTREVISDEIEGVSRETEAKVIVTIADMEERKRAERLIHRASLVLRKQATNTIFGYVAPRERVPEIQHRLDSIAFDAENFNAESRTCKVKIGILTLDISQALVDPSTVKEIARHVIGELTELRGALRAGKASLAQSILSYRVANLHELAVGTVSEAIRFAVDECTQQLRTLKAKVKGDGAISETPESAGRGLDLSMLDSALGMLGAAVEDPPISPGNDNTPASLVAA